MAVAATRPAGTLLAQPANGYFDSWTMAAFPEAMLKDPAGRFVVVWDGGPMPKGDPIRDLMGHFTDRSDLERLPP